MLGDTVKSLGRKDGKVGNGRKDPVHELQPNR